MKLKVITPDHTLFEGNVERINIAEREGAFEVLKRHAPLITVIKNFVSTIQKENGELTHIAAGSGTLKVLNNEVFLIVDYGVVGGDKEEAKTNLINLRREIAQNYGSLGDDTVAKLETLLMKRMKEMRS